MKILFSLSLILLTFTVFAQEYPLDITDIKVEVNGKKVEIDYEIHDKLQYGHVKEITIYEDDKYIYKTNFVFTRSGNRLKLNKRNMAFKKGGNTEFGKWNKDVQFLDTSVKGKFYGSKGESLTLDKRTFESIAVTFTYEVNYRPQ